jgi:CBS domain containing-hemolysin-like protein
MTLFIVSALVALSVSFLCSLLEATLLSLTPSQVADIASKRPKLGAIWQGFKTNIERPISVILALNTAAYTIGASVAGSQFDDIFGNRWIWVFSLVFTFLMLQFTEILPKTLGVRFNRELATFIARPLSVSITVFTPLLRLIHWINRPFEVKRDFAAPVATADEIAALAGLARLSNQINFHQERIIKGASRLAALKAQDVMIPVEQVAFLSTSRTLPEAVIAAHIDCHTRFPVCEDNDRNRVVGYINFKEMIYFMRTNPNDSSLKGIIRPVHFVLPDDSAADLMKVFVEQHVHIAIVRDSGGKTLGMVTLEDLVEELVGELQDEFDRLPRMFHTLSGGIWMVGGGMPMAELSQRLQLPLPASQETVSAWLYHRLGHIPKPGDIYREATAEFVVRRVRRGKAFEVAVNRPNVEPGPVAPAQTS